MKECGRLGILPEFNDDDGSVRIELIDLNGTDKDDCINTRGSMTLIDERSSIRPHHTRVVPFDSFRRREQMLCVGRYEPTENVPQWIEATTRHVPETRKQ